MNTSFERTPIDISALPATVQKHLDANAPPQLKMMAAQGMLPLAPEDNVIVLYQLANFADEKTRPIASKSFAGLPTEIIQPVIPKLTHDGVLDFVAAKFPKVDVIVEAVVMNNATANMTIARLASKVSTNLCDVIATNQVRILKAPSIIEQLYLNPNARMATIDRTIELAIREGVELKGLPGLREALASKTDLFAGGQDDAAFEALLQEQAEKGAAEDLDIEGMENLSRGEKEKLLEELGKTPERTGSVHAQIMQMSIAQKVRLATIGSREAINILVRDPNKLVSNAAAKSPRVKYPDVRAWAKEKSIPDNVISYIAGNKDYNGKYEIQRNLCQNPKTPLADVLRLLNHLRGNDLKKLSMNRNVPTQVSRQAKALFQKRSGRK